MTGRYINEFRVNQGEHEIRLLLDEDHTSAFNFVLSPSLAKSLAQDLTNQIKEYEEKFGKINTDDILTPEDQERKGEKHSYS